MDIKLPRYEIINARVELGMDNHPHLRGNIVTRPFVPEGTGNFAGPNQEVVTPPLLSRFPGGARTQRAEYQVLVWAEDQPTQLYTDIEEIL